MNKKIRDEEIYKIIELRKSGLSWQEIAQIFSVSRQQIMNIAKKLGLTKQRIKKTVIVNAEYDCIDETYEWLKKQQIKDSIYISLEMSRCKPVIKYFEDTPWVIYKFYDYNEKRRIYIRRADAPQDLPKYLHTKPICNFKPYTEDDIF